MKKLLYAFLIISLIAAPTMATTRALQITELLTPVIDYRTNSVASGYTAYFYSAGTSSAKNVWTEKEKTNPYTSRTLGSDGTAQVYGDGVYRIIIKDTDGTTVYDWDNIKVQANTFTIQTKSDTYTATADDDLILCSGTFTVNLAAVTGFSHPLIIKRVSGTITIDPYSDETIDGSSTISLTSADDSAVLYPDTVSGTWRRADRLSGLTATTTEINNKCDDDDGSPLWTSATSQKPAMGLKNTNVDENGPILKGIKDSASPADSDQMLLIEGHGDDSGGTETTFASIKLKSADVTDTDEAGEIELSAIMDGIERSLLKLSGYNGSVDEGEIVVNEDGQDIDFRVEATGQANALKVQGSDGAVSIAYNLDVTGTGTLGTAVLNTSATGTAIKDQDDMASDSAVHLSSQQSIKAYADRTGGVWVTNANGNANISDIGRDIDSTYTAAWTSTGPTGSGATVTWTALDSVPSWATCIKVRIIHSITRTTGSLDIASVALYARKNGGSESIGNDNMIDLIKCYGSSTTTEYGTAAHAIEATIPISSSGIFDLYYVEGSTTTTDVCEMYLIAYKL